MIANGTAPPPLPSAEGTVPDWFARKRLVREAKAVAEAARTVDEKNADDPSVGRRIVAWLLGGAAVGYGVSLLFHLVLLVLFSVVVIHLGRGGSTISTELGVAEEGGDEFLDTRAFEVSSGSEGVEEPVAVVEPLPLESPNLDLQVADAISPDLKGVADGSGESDISTDGSGDGPAFELPKGGNAVQEGSFTAWTVPDDPRVGQDYIIVVEVTLPDGTERYARSDLAGQLVGTDGYKVAIPDGREFNGLGWSRPKRTPVFRREGEKARIVFFVRGAHQALVRDTILIRSRLLDEQQKLQIVF